MLCGSEKSFVFRNITMIFPKAIHVVMPLHSLCFLILHSFCSKKLAVPKESRTFVAVKRESFKDITVMRAKQEIFISEAKKLQDYLVVPNNLLLSLSLSLSL